jgi:hypothetical protein
MKQLHGTNESNDLYEPTGMINDDVLLEEAQKKVIKNRTIEAFSKRTKKISHALIIVRDSIKDSGVLKAEVEKLALDLTKDICVFETRVAKSAPDFTDIVLRLTQALAIVDLLFFAKNISRENLDLVKGWILSTLSLARIYEEEHTELHMEILLSSPEAFETPQRASLDIPATTDVSTLPEPAMKQSVTVRARSVQKVAPVTTNARRQQILDLVKSKGNAAQGGSIQIKDVAAVITDCSEKTIQRELSSLVEDGLLVKEGDRRWTTYRLA